MARYRIKIEGLIDAPGTPCHKRAEKLIARELLELLRDHGLVSLADRAEEGPEQEALIDACGKGWLELSIDVSADAAARQEGVG